MSPLSVLEARHAVFVAWSFSDMPLYPHLYSIPIIFMVGVAVGWLMRHVYRDKR